MATAKFVPLEKRSKREQREVHAARRADWNGVNPATKVIPDRRRKLQDKHGRLSDMSRYD